MFVSVCVIAYQRMFIEIFRLKNFPSPVRLDDSSASLIHVLYLNIFFPALLNINRLL